MLLLKRKANLTRKRANMMDEPIHKGVVGKS